MSFFKSHGAQFHMQKALEVDDDLEGLKLEKQTVTS